MTDLIDLQTARPATAQDRKIAASLQRHAIAARGTMSPNSERALRSDILIFSRWCAANRLKHLPATPDTVAAFLDAMATTKATATCRRYAASIAHFHRAAEVANPGESLRVSQALARMHRDKGRLQQQAGAITAHQVSRMIIAAGRRFRDLRDKALLTVAYSTLCRRSELVELRFEGLVVDDDNFGTIAIARSKSDQEGRGAVAAIPPDAMVHLLAWLTAAKITEGPLFRSVRRGAYKSIGGKLGGRDVSLIFKRMAVRARFSADEVARISAHSSRVGAAQDMIRFEVDMAAAMQAGRWKNPEMLARYTRRLGVRYGAVAKVSAKREQFA